jgi:hypothetical protein
MFGFLLRILASIILTGISAYLSYRKPTQPSPGTEEDLGNPRADEGTEIIKVFGTVTIADPQVVWFGDFKTTPIVEKGGRKYGLFGPKQKTTIGFNYYLGMHLVLCLGPVDNVNRIRIDKRIAFSGVSTGGQIDINEPTLFGSEKREGGVSGKIDVLLGAASQAANDYLAAAALGPTPAYRGVSSLVLRQLYIGNAPSLRPWEVKVRRIAKTDPGYNGGDQWYPAKATIVGPSSNVVARYQFSMGGKDLPVGRRGPAQIIADDNGFVIETAPTDTITIYPTMPSPDATRFPDTEYNIASDPQGDGTWQWEMTWSRNDTFSLGNFTAASGLSTPELALAAAQAVAPRSETGFSKYRFWVNLEGVNTVASLSPLRGGISAEIVVSRPQIDINPVHILREILLSPDSGGTGIAGEAGSTWTAAADTIFTEGFGLSIAWRGSTDRVDFKKEIERHIDARSYIDRRTGLWEIKLIRDDYNVATLPIFDQSNVASWDNINFPQPGSLLNQLVVTWSDPEKDETTSLTISNPARIRMAGSQVFQEKVDYPGIQRADLAGRVAMRDLSARSAPLITGEFTAKNFPTNLNIGSAIIINNPRLGILSKVVRITEIDDGNIRDSSVVVKFIEDKFSIANQSLLDIEIIEKETITPRPVTPRLVEEAPLYLLTQQLGPENVSLVLAEDEEAGFAFMAGGKPTQTSFDALIFRDLGSGYEEIQNLNFSPAARTIGVMTTRADRTKVVVESRDGEAFASLAAGALVWVGGEQMVLVSIEEGDTSSPSDYWAPTLASTLPLFTLTLERGAMDTAPARHGAGSGVVFYEGEGYLEDDIQTDGDIVRIKLRTDSSQGVLSLASTPVDEITFASRALRPYPPGDLKLDGDYQVDPPEPSDTYALTWEHRDRTEGSLIGHTETGPASPEAGTEYIVRVEALGEGDTVLAILTEDNVSDDLAYSWVPVAAPSGTIYGRFSVTSVRGGIESWTSPFILARINEGARAIEGSNDERATEDGTQQIRVIEE